MDRPTDFNRSVAELEEFLMAGVCVAGKSALTQARRLGLFLRSPFLAKSELGLSPFEKVKALSARSRLYDVLVQVGMGKYSLITQSFRAMTRDPHLDLRVCSWERLAQIPGIGIKTAKFFVLHSRPNQALAVLDTHMHKHLVQNGFAPPRFSPASRSAYTLWQTEVLGLADRAGMSPAGFDLHVWSKYRRPEGPRAYGAER